MQLTQMGTRFNDFHKSHPEVYELFCLYTAEAIAAGHRRFSADAIAHRVRWNRAVETTSGRRGVFALNNNFVAFYARLWQADHPRHRNFFETRVSAADVVERAA